MLETIKNLLSSGQEFITTYWLLLVISGFSFLFLEKVIKVLWDKRLHKLRHHWVDNIQWSTFQLRFPKENLKSPKAMEQVIASLHGNYSFGIPWRSVYIEGEIEYWVALEIVGRSTGTSFYARVMQKHGQMFRNAFFAQYPEAEIIEVEDYMHEFPEKLPNETYRVYGGDYTLDKKNEHGHSVDAYPIKTYEFFESPSDEKRLDPMATITEAVANLKEDETMFIQLLISPTGIEENHHLKEGAEGVKDKIMGREKKKHGKGIGAEIFSLLKHLVFAFVAPPEFGEKEEEKKMNFKMYTQGESDTLKAIDNKLSKNLFESVLRFVYLDRRDAFTKENVFAFFGAVTQFSERNMNAFRPSKDSFTIHEYLKRIKGSPKRFNKDKRIEKRAGHLWQALRHRSMPLGHHVTLGDRFIKEFVIKTSVLSAEEIATIFHPPGALRPDCRSRRSSRARCPSDPSRRSRPGHRS